MFIALLIDQHLRIILSILDDILIISPTRFSVRWHHQQGAQFNFKFSETHQMITSTCWPHATQNIQHLIIIKMSSLTYMSIEIAGSLNQFSHRLHHSE